MTKINNHISNIINAAGIVFVGLIFSKLLSYLYVILLARLGSSIYGLLSLGFTIISFLSVLSLMGLKSAILRYVPFYKGKKNAKRIRGTIISSIFLSLPVSIVASLLLFIFSKQIALQLFHNPDLEIILKITAFLIPIKGLSRIFLTSIQAFKQIKYSILIEQIIENFVKLTLTFILIYLGFNILGPIIAYIIASLITLILSLYFLNKKIFSFINKKIKPIYDKKELLLFSLPLLFSDLLVNTIKSIDTWFIGAFRTTSEVGLYNAALPTANLLVLIPTALMALFVPIVTELYAKNKVKEIKEISKFISKWIFFINIPIAAFLIIFSKQVLSVMFGKEYSVAYFAMIILIISHIFYSLNHINSNILQMLKRTKLILITFIISTLINVVLNFILIPIYGIVGAAIAVFAYFLSLYILMSFFVFKYKKIQILRVIYMKSILAALITSFIIIQLAKILKPISIINLLILSFILFIIYSLFVILFKGLEKEDISIFNYIKNKFLNKN